MPVDTERLYKRLQLASLPVIFRDSMKRLEHDVVRGCQVYGNFYWIPLASPKTIFQVLATRKMQGEPRVLMWTSDAPQGSKTNTIEAIMRSSGLKWIYLDSFYHWELIDIETKKDPEGRPMDSKDIKNWKYVYLPGFWDPYIEEMLDGRPDRNIDLDSLGQMLGMCVLELREERFTGRSTFRALEYLINDADHHRKNGLIVPQPLAVVENKFAQSLSRKRFCEVFQSDISKSDQLRFFLPQADGTVSYNEDMFKAYRLVNKRANQLIQKYQMGYTIDEFGEPTVGI